MNLPGRARMEFDGSGADRGNGREGVATGQTCTQTRISMRLGHQPSAVVYRRTGSDASSLSLPSHPPRSQPSAAQTQTGKQPALGTDTLHTTRKLSEGGGEGEITRPSPCACVGGAGGGGGDAATNQCVRRHHHAAPGQGGPKETRGVGSIQQRLHVFPQHVGKLELGTDTHTHPRVNSMAEKQQRHDTTPN